MRNAIYLYDVMDVMGNVIYLFDALRPWSYNASGFVPFLIATPMHTLC